MNINATFQDSNVFDIFLVNGLFQPKLEIKTGEEVILDILNASGDHILEIDIRSDIGHSIITQECIFTHLAADGVYFDEPRSASFIVIVSFVFS
jgi:hypothetical protein